MANGRFRRSAACALCVLATVVVVIGCSSDEPPPRSPLGPDTGTAPASTSTATVSPTAVGTATVTATPPPAPGTPVAVDRELAIGKAIERMAQWLGVDQTDLVFSSFEEQSFSNACLGVARPGIACAEVITPGASVLLLDRIGAGHEVRADAVLQSFVWAPEVTAAGSITAIDHAAGTLTLDAGGIELRLRLAPGTLQDVSFADLAVGAEIAVGFDPTPAENQPDVLAWVSG